MSLPAVNLSKLAVCQSLQTGGFYYGALWKRVGVITGKQLDVFAHLQSFRDLGDLQHGAHTNLGLRTVRIFSENLDSPLVGCSQSQQQFDLSCFSRSSVAEEPHQL